MTNAEVKQAGKEAEKIAEPNKEEELEKKNHALQADLSMHEKAGKEKDLKIADKDELIVHYREVVKDLSRDS